MPRGEKALPELGAYVSDGYFRTMDIPILAGRGFLESDRENAPLVAVVNEHMAKHYWPKGDALGKRFHLGTATGPLIEIVGIARMAKYLWIAEPPLDFVYLPFRQHPRSTMSLVAESNAQDAATLAPVLRDVVHSLDPDMPVFDVRTMQRLLYAARGEDADHHHSGGGRPGPDGPDSGGGGSLRPGGLLGEPPHARNRHPHGHRRGPAEGGVDGAAAGAAARRGRGRRGSGGEFLRLPPGHVVLLDSSRSNASIP